MNSCFSHSLYALLFILLGCSAGGCQSRSSHHPSPAASTENTTALTRFPLIEIPPLIASPEERADYLLSHYWENFDFSDTTLLHRTDITEQGVVDYLDLLRSQAHRKIEEKSFQAFCNQFARYPEARKIMPDLLKKYLYESNSPFHNEPLFATFLDKLLQVPQLQNDPSQSRWRFLRTLLQQNNPGQRACDFTYETLDGKMHTLYHTQGPQLLLFFYDPQCENCYHTLLKLKASHELATAIAQGQLTVLAVHTEEEITHWKATAAELPAHWIVATDRGYIQAKALYDLKAMPTLYLLDAQKQVILKDAPLEIIFAHLGFALPRGFD